MPQNNSTPEALRQLTEHFRALGADDPESWARSELEEGVPQYARLVFLRRAWKRVIADGSTAWIDALIRGADRDPRGPGAGAGPALRRLLAVGADPNDLAEVVRVMQWELLFGLTYQLGAPDEAEYPSADMPRVKWALFEVNNDDEPGRPIAGLHESVLDTDPSGREMRPKGVGREG